MRILLASVEDVHDVRSWSGTPFHMHAALCDAGADVVTAGPLHERFSLPFKVLQATRNVLGPGYYSRLREPVILRGYAAQLRAVVAAARPDVVLAPSTIPVAHLEVDVPIVTWTDATFAGLLDYYPSYSNLSARYRRLGHLMERRALRRVSRAVYTSEWAARSAVDVYQVPIERVEVVPFGANLAHADERSVATTEDTECHLLLIGRGWYRKGIDIAVETSRRLRDHGVPAVLDVVGSRPPPGARLPAFVRVHGALEKDDPRAAAEIARLYRTAAFFLLPTRADCTPVVLAEAQAHGVPVVASRTGGTRSMLRDGHSGLLVELTDFPAHAARAMARVWASPAEYRGMQDAARRFYDHRLNWSSAVASVLGILNGLCR